MDITFAPRGILQIDDARITYKNFAGEGGPYNREGDRNFALIIDDPELADRLLKAGWNVKSKPSRNDEDEMPFMYLPVKVKFNDRGPNIYLISGSNRITLDEGSVGCLDKISMLRVDLDIRPYDWDVNGKTGRTAYLHGMKVTQRITDRFAEENDYEGYYED